LVASESLPDATPDELAGLIMHWMRRVTRPPTQELEALQLAGITLHQMISMHLLRFGVAGLGMPQSVLAERLGLSMSATSTMVQKLVEAGLVLRSEDAEDRRIKRLAMSDVGQAVVDRMLAHRMAEMRRSVEPLSSSTRNLLRTALDAVLRELPEASFLTDCLPAKEKS
jgi:DNA-binding MarR family transcriptional regulator